MKVYYAARAAEYDRVYQKPERQADIARLQAWLPTFFVGSRVVDIAAGTGFWSQHIAAVATNLVAVDASIETLSIARGRLPAGKTALVVGDVYGLPFGLGTFNAAFVGFWFSHVPKADQRAFLTELHRVLRRDSIVILLDNLYVDGSNHPISETDGDGNTYQCRRLEDGSEHRVLKNFPTRAELADAAGEGGSDAEYTLLDYYWAFRYRTGGTGRV